MAVVGPTGSGKSQLAEALARAHGASILSCDSIQVYRGCDIGSAKPSRLAQSQVLHHLIDMAAPSEPFDAAKYVTAARQARAQDNANDRPTILCGGTGLYLRAFRYGLGPLPASDPALRDRLVAQEHLTPGSLGAELTRLDPTSAQTIDPRNLMRVARALEITLLTGKPASLLRAAHGFNEPLENIDVWALVPDPSVLRARIVRRTQRMLDEGFVNEVEHLLGSGVDADAKPLRAVGYREVVLFLKNELRQEHLFEAIVTATWAYARRQRTWLRREKNIRYLDASLSEEELVHFLSKLWAS